MLAQQLASAVNAATRPFCPHTPHPRQAEFLALDEEEAFYGGAGGGGKSDALLMAALQYVHVPNYNALLLRRTFRALNEPEAIMARADSWLRGNPRCKWEGEEKQWRFLESNATLGFGYFDAARDRDNYQGGAYQFIGWDELTQFPSGYYTYMFSRLRKPKDGPLSQVPLRMRGAANPGGIGHEWVFRRFVDPKTARARFIPAKLADNPSVDAASYLAMLDRADSTTARQIRDGIWVRDSSGLVYAFDADRNIAPRPADILGSPWVYVAAMDFGVTDATAFSVLAWRLNDPRVFVVESYKRRGMSPSAAAEEYLRLDAKYHFGRVVGDLGGLGKAFGEEMRDRFSVPIEPADKQNKRGYISLLNGDLERGRIILAPGTTDELRDEWFELPWKDDSHTAEADGFENHCADATLYGWRACPNYHERVPSTHRETDAERIDREMDEFHEREEQRAKGNWWER